MTLRLLQHPRPLEYESLANYFHRLAEANSCQMAWLFLKFKQQYNKKAVLRGKLNAKRLNRTENETINVMAEAAKIPVEELKRMSVNSLIRYYSEDTTKFCPFCLLEKRYHRIYWQSNMITVCLKHQTILLDKCDKCGALVSIDDLIRGYCSCGRSLVDIKPIHCNDEMIVFLNQKIYDALGIQYNEIVSEGNFPTLSSRDFVDFFTFFKARLSLFLDKIKDLDYRDNNPHELESDLGKELFCCKYLGKLMYDWPQSFISLLDEVNQITHNSKIRLDYLPITNPISILGSPRSLPEIPFLSETLFNYLIDNTNPEFYQKRFKTENGMIFSLYITDILGLDYKDPSAGGFPYTSTSKPNYIKLEDAVSYLETFLALGKLPKEKFLFGCKPLPYFFDKVSKLGISYKDILNIVSNDNIEVFINIHENGLNMFNVPINQTMRALLQYALTKLE